MDRLEIEKEDSKTVRLKRELGLCSTVNLIFNCVIGSGIFVTPGIVLQQSGSVGMTIVVWVLSGGISVLGALSFAEMSTVVPSSGGQYAYFLIAFKDLHPCFGPLIAFSFVWVEVMILAPAATAVLSILFVTYLYEPIRVAFYPQSDATQLLLIKNIAGTLTILLIGCIHYVSVKVYVRTSNILAYCKLVGCMLVIVGGVYMVCSGKSLPLNIGFEGTDVSLKAIGMAFYGGLYSYDGWNVVSAATEEIKHPEKNILRSVLISIPLVTILYVVMNVSFLTAMTKDEIINDSAIVTTFVARACSQLDILTSIVVALTALGSALSMVYFASRLCYVAAREGHMMELMSYIHKTRLSPAPSIILQVLLAVIYLLAGDLESLISFYNFLIWIFYGITMVTLFVLRVKKPDAPRPFKVPLVFPATVALIALLLSLIPLFTQPIAEYLIALLLILIGVVLYCVFVYMKLRLPGIERFSTVVQKTLHIVPTSAEPEM